jgi:predicted nucleic acid-binding protein
VVAVAPTEHHWPPLSNLLKTTGAACNLVSDSHLAALALEQGYAIYSTDHDFKRFSGLTHINPLE